MLTPSMRGNMWGAGSGMWLQPATPVVAKSDASAKFGTGTPLAKPTYSMPAINLPSWLNLQTILIIGALILFLMVIM